MSWSIRPWWLLLLVLAASSPASASSVVLEYDVTPECPPAAEFEAALATRGADLNAASAKPGVLGLKVEIAREEGQYFGKLHVRSGEGTSAEREVHAAECGEVVKGLAVVAAIALGAPVEQAATPAAPPPEAAAPQPEATVPREDQKPSRLRGTSFRREEKIEVSAGTLRIDQVRTFDLSAGANFNLVPGLVLPRYDFTLGVVHFLTPPRGESRIVGPIMQVNWQWVGPGTLHKDGYTSAVNGLGAGVRACSAVTYDSDGFVFDFCGEFGLAWMHAETKGPDGTVVESKDTGLGTAGLGVGLAYNFGSHIHIGVRGAGQLQLGGLEARRPDGGKLFELPLFGGHAEVGVGLHFW